MSIDVNNIISVVFEFRNVHPIPILRVRDMDTKLKISYPKLKPYEHVKFEYKTKLNTKLFLIRKLFEDIVILNCLPTYGSQHGVMNVQLCVYKNGNVDTIYTLHS
jgi:hypothetical protein